MKIVLGRDEIKDYMRRVIPPIFTDGKIIEDVKVDYYGEMTIVLGDLPKVEDSNLVIEEIVEKEIENGKRSDDIQAE